MTFQKATWRKSVSDSLLDDATLIVPISPAAARGWAAKIAVGRQWVALDLDELGALHEAVWDAYSKALNVAADEALRPLPPR